MASNTTSNTTSPSILVRKEFVFHGEKLGCTQMVRVSQAGSTQKLIGKVIPPAKLQEFLVLEGAARRVLHSYPHDHIHPLLLTLEEDTPATPLTSFPSSTSSASTSPSASPTPSSSSAPADAASPASPASSTTSASSASHSQPPFLLGGPQRSGYLVFGGVDVDLHTYVRAKGFLTEDDARPLFRQIVSAVAHCHRHNVVLRDMKLGKMYFTDKEQTHAVIADLEGAQLVSERDSTLHDQKGSPAYVSPEVLLCQPYDGKAADVWALGVVLFVLLTGAYPFQDNRPTTLFQKIQQAAAGVSFPATMSIRAKHLIKRLLSKEPTRRPAARDILDEPWLALPITSSSSSGSAACVADTTTSSGAHSTDTRSLFLRVSPGCAPVPVLRRPRDWSPEDFAVPECAIAPVSTTSAPAAAAQPVTVASAATVAPVAAAPCAPAAAAAAPAAAPRQKNPLSLRINPVAINAEAVTHPAASAAIAPAVAPTTTSTTTLSAATTATTTSATSAAVAGASLSAAALISPSVVMLQNVTTFFSDASAAPGSHAARAPRPHALQRSLSASAGSSVMSTNTPALVSTSLSTSTSPTPQPTSPVSSAAASPPTARRHGLVRRTSLKRRTSISLEDEVSAAGEAEAAKKATPIAEEDTTTATAMVVASN